MGDPSRSAAKPDWWLIVAAILALGLVIGGISYRYFSDDLIELAQSLTSGKTGRPQSHFHY
jgi:hypothetical protein